MKPITTQNLIRSFGRVNGRKLRVGQANLMESLLPSLAVDVEKFSIEKLFPEPQRELWLEVGFGYGEHLVGMAAQYPDVNFIGCEPFVNGVATLLKHIDESKVSNIRILHGDARLLINKLPDASITRLFILFPDPWPKLKHHKKRIISEEGLKEFARIIKPGGRFDVATDHVAYGEWIAEHLEKNADFQPNEILGLATQPADWVPTRYQLKASQQGRGARFFNYIKKPH
jgi:tRNA (guanine-N7-)-methyltransferase